MSDRHAGSQDHTTRLPRVATIDALRGLTILWVTALHFHVDTRAVPTPAVASASAWWDAVSAGDPAGALRVTVASLVGLPGFRLDLLLLVTSLVAGLGTTVPATTFLRRRALAILPHYWLGNLLVLLVAGLCAAWRSTVLGTPWLGEFHAGSRLALEPYRIEGLDLLRSLSVVGRLQDPRTMQVVAPSLWYLVLVAQLLLVLPWLRRLHAALGGARMIVLAIVATAAGRAWVFAAPPLATFDANATVITFLPFRLVGPAIGLACAGLIRARSGDLGTLPWAPRSPLAAATAVGAILPATWAGIAMNAPGTLAGVLGPTIPLALAWPGLWWLASACGRRPWLGPFLTWAGVHSLSILVAQDALRFIVGTLVSLGWLGGAATFLLLPVYLLLATLLARAWAPWPLAVVTCAGRDDGRASSTGIHR